MLIKFVENNFNIIFIFYIISNITVYIDCAVKSKKTFLRKPSRYQQNSYLSSNLDYG